MAKNRGIERRKFNVSLRAGDFKDEKQENDILRYIDSLTEDRQLSSKSAKWIVEGAYWELNENYLKLFDYINEYGIDEVLIKLKELTSPKPQLDYEAFASYLINKLKDENIIISTVNKDNEDNQFEEDSLDQDTINNNMNLLKSFL